MRCLLSKVVVGVVLAATTTVPVLIDGWAPKPTTPPRCFEDEAIVEVVSNYVGGQPYVGFEPGDRVCVPYDDIEVRYGGAIAP